MKKSGIKAFLSLFIVASLYQNCSKGGFQALDNGGNRSSLSENSQSEFKVICLNPLTQTTLDQGQSLYYWSSEFEKSELDCENSKKISLCSEAKKNFDPPLPPKIFGSCKVDSNYSNPTTTSTTPTTQPPVVTTTSTTTTTKAPMPTSELTQITFLESTENIPNPERGFYDRIDLMSLTEDQVISLRDKGNSIYQYPLRLIYTQIDISNFRNSDFSSSFLQTLEAKFMILRKSSMKIIPRFVYDDSEKGLDATSAQIQRHLSQVGPILSKYQDVIAYFQAGFVGAWGEWHSSQSGNSFGYNSPSNVTEAQANQKRLEIKNSLVQNVPSSIPLSFRLPADIIRWSSGNPSASSFGFINDCWLAGADDEGTFLSNDERTYIQSLTLTRPFGGETCSDPSVVLRNSCAESVAEAKLYHLTYLNSGYSLDFINRWKSENCFIDIAKKMGHRFVLVDLKFPKLLSINGTLHLELKINNSGFSKIFKERIVYAVLKNISTGEKININLGNLVSLMPNSNMTYGVDLNLVGSGIKAGSYDVYIGMPDQSLLKINEIALANNAFNSIRPINSDSPGKNQIWDVSNSQFKTGAVIQIQ